MRNLCIIDELGAEEGEERDRVRRASWEFLKFLLSEEQCAADFDVTADLPCYDNLLENEAFQAGFEKWGEDMTDTMEVGNHVLSVPLIPALPAISWIRCKRLI